MPSPLYLMHSRLSPPTQPPLAFLATLRLGPETSPPPGHTTAALWRSIRVTPGCNSLPRSASTRRGRRHGEGVARDAEIDESRARAAASTRQSVHSRSE